MLDKVKMPADGYFGTGEDLMDCYPGRYEAPKPNQLFIDIDSAEQYELYKERLPMFLEFCDAVTTERASKSGLPRRHIIVDLKYEFSVAERLFLQMFLNSDSTREMLSFVRHQMGDKYPILLRKP